MSRRIARAERRKKAKTLLKIIIILSVVILAVGLVYQIGKNTIEAVDRINRTVKPAEWGCVEDKLSTRAIVLNKEVAIPAEYEGHFENLVKEREKIRKGTLLGYYVSYNKRTAVNAPDAGLFSQQTDGLESIFGGISLQEVSKEVFAYQPRYTIDSDGPIYSGQAICKIVDNLSPTRLIVHFPVDKLSFQVEKNQQVTITDGKNDLGKAIIRDMKKDSDELFMILEFNNFHEELLNKRFIDIVVLFQSQYGYIVPKKALVDKGQEKGIYCTQGENIIFKPVKVLVLKEETVIIEGLNRNDIIITNP